MTDEEMADKHAEEYVMREDTITENDRVPFDNGYGFQTVDFEKEVKKGYKDGFLAGLKAGRPQWHKLDWEKYFPDVDKLVRVRTRSGAEYICETYSYFPAEDEIGYGSVITQFSELNGDWVDDNEIEYWCEIPTFDKE